jgi:hypothetical protein
MKKPRTSAASLPPGTTWSSDRRWHDLSLPINCLGQCYGGPDRWGQFQRDGDPATLLFRWGIDAAAARHHTGIGRRSWAADITAVMSRLRSSFVGVTPISPIWSGPGVFEAAERRFRDDGSQTPGYEIVQGCRDIVGRLAAPEHLPNASHMFTASNSMLGSGATRPRHYPE